MSKTCINHNDPGFKKLVEETKLPKGFVETAIYGFQRINDTDDFPSSDFVVYYNRPDKSKQLDDFYSDPSLVRTLGTPVRKIDLAKFRNKVKSNIEHYSKKYPLLTIEYQKTGGPDGYYKLVAYNKSQEDTVVDKAVFFTLADKLKSKFGLDYEFVSKEKAKEILKGHNYNGEPAFFYGNKIYFTEFNLEDPIHEYSHPFIRGIRKSNPELFFKLAEEAYTSNYSEVDYVIKNYPEFLDEDGYLNEYGVEEVLVRVLTNYAKESVNPETGEINLGKKIWDSIINFLKKIFGVKVANVKDLNPNVKLKDLSKFFIGFEGKIELKSPEEINYKFRSVENIYKNINKVTQWFKQIGNNDVFWNKIQKDLGIPKDQIELLKQSEGNTIEEKLSSFVANYSYTVEINTAKEGTDFYGVEDFRIGDTRYYTVTGEKFYKVENDFANNFNKESVEIDFKEFEKAAEQYKDINKQPTQHYSYLTVPGGTNYTEHEIATPAITPSIKGHAQFATDNGIGWFRSDDKHAFTGFLEDLLASGTIKKVPCG